MKKFDNALRKWRTSTEDNLETLPIEDSHDLENASIKCN